MIFIRRSPYSTQTSHINVREVKQTGSMEPTNIQERVRVIESKRETLLQLLEQPDLGTLRIDVNQALEELDDLIEEFQRTFPAKEQ